MTPTDPLYANQWHFALMGRLGTENLIQRIWDEYTGAGVKIGVFDDGVQSTHSDLDANYNRARELTVGGVAISGAHGTGGRHGTAVAGLIAAENNGEGGVGVAYGASLSSINIFDPSSPIYVNTTDPVVRARFMEAVRQAAQFDVINNSWAQKPGFRPAQSAADATSFAAQTAAAYAEISATGRGGLGTLIVQAAGNDNLDANGDGLHASRHTITVGAVHNDGFASSYSNYGACLLVSAAGGDLATVRNGQGIVTADATGAAGYNLRGATTVASDFTNDFGGTSAATPLVTGVIALMLQANPNLGWRDVQNILSMSANHTGSAIGSTTAGTQENNTWFINKGDNWNGGGQHFSEDYGYGLVNAYVAVRLAEVWHLFAPAKTSANERTVSTGQLQPNIAIADKSTTTYTFTVGQNISMESASLTLNITHSYFTDLRIYLVSPEGTEVQLFDGRSGSGSTADNGITWTFGIEALRGELSAGTWTLRIVDAVTSDAGRLNGVKLDVYGSTPTTDDVFTYTDEFIAMAALDAKRRTLTDTDGGTDWINAAGMTGNISLNLNAGTSSTVNGQAFITVASGTLIENAVTGDGHDVVNGNALNNIIYGMRGNDRLNGWAGNDSLYGGAGNDTLDGGAGADNLYGDAGTADTALYTASTAAITINLATNINTGGDAQGDRLYGIERVSGSHFADHITGDNNANALYGNGGNDTLYGGGGNDSLVGGDGNDTLYGDDGIDSFFGGAGADTMYGGAGTLDIAYYSTATTAVTINLATNVNTGSDAAGDILIGIERVVGSAYGDSLTGDAQSNYLYGQAGSDVLNGGLGNDVLYGGADSDTFRFTEINFGADFIADFTDTGAATDDRLSFALNVADSFSDFTFVGNGTASVTVTIIGGQTFTVRGPAPITLGADDFVFV